MFLTESVIVSKLISKETINKVSSSNNIVEVISRYINLKKKGKYFWGLCPFQSENTPSFTVDEEKQRYKCYSCGRSGNIFNFIEEMEHLSFPDSVIRLADKKGIKIDSRYRENFQGRFNSRQQELLKINKKVSIIFNYLLLNTTLSKKAKDYLIKKRHLDQEDIKNFQIGYLPPKWSLHNFLSSKHISDATQLALGLVSQYSDKNFRDVFADRIIIPLKDNYGNILGFSGRSLNKNVSAKYINTQENELFKKSKILYHFDIAKQAAKTSKSFLLLEGYFDVIAAHKAGIDFGIASMGTSLTKYQLKMISRNSNKLIVCYDGDEAGQDATWRIIKETISFPDLNIGILNIPNGEDPDEFVQRNGLIEFKNIVQKGIVSIEDFAFEYLKKNYNLNNISGVSGYINSLLTFLKQRNNPVANDLILNKIIREFKISRESIKQLFEAKQINKHKKNRNIRISNSKVNHDHFKSSVDRKVFLLEKKLIVSSVINKKVFSLVDSHHYTFKNGGFQLYFFLIKGYRYRHPEADNVSKNLLDDMTANEREDFKNVVDKDTDFYLTDNLLAIKDYISQLENEIPIDKRIKELEKDIQKAINLNQDTRIKKLNIKLVKLRKEKLNNIYG